MSDLVIPPTNDVSALKKLEKKIIKEGKNEDSRVSHDLKDLTKLEKASGKAAKALDKSQHALEKTHRKEHSATKDLNKAIHKHDLTVAAIANAEKDLEAKKAEAARLEAELAKKKDSVNGVVEGQRQHNSLRETKLAEIHHVRAGTTSSTTNTNTNPAPNATGTYTDTIASSPASHTGPSAAIAPVDENKADSEAGVAGVGSGMAPSVNA